MSNTPDLADLKKQRADAATELQTIDHAIASLEALNTSLGHAELLYIGLNCATGPAFMTDHLRSLAALAITRVGAVPNAGLPDEDGVYLESPAMMASQRM